jgi:hypothetical protein
MLTQFAVKCGEKTAYSQVPPQVSLALPVQAMVHALSGCFVAELRIVSPQ